MLRLVLAATASLVSTHAMAAPLDGRYEAPCALEASGSVLEAWVFAGGVGRFFHQISHYNDDACTQLDVTEAPAGNFTSVDQDDGSRTLDLRFVRPEGIPPLYTIVEIDGDVLYVGALSATADGSAPDRRPAEVDRSVGFVRQP